jgi:dTDP-4-amino-4,6-dideoxygalactose transaminase
MAQLTEAGAYRHIRPRAPTRPLISGIERPVAQGPKASSILDLPYVAWFSNGRSAIAHAAILSGISPDSSVLVPAYHCESMIAPLAWLGPRVIPYRIREDLTIDLDHLVSVSDSNTRLVLAPQYFGHWRSTAELYRLAKSSNWTLVEDCAHAFFAICDPAALGAYSDFMVASAPKFFATFDGGVLASRARRFGWPYPHRPSLVSELHTLSEAVEYAFGYGRWPWIACVIRPAIEGIRRLMKRPEGAPTGGNAQPASRYGGVEFEPAYMNSGATLFSRLLARHSNRAAISDARRKNWAELRDRIGTSRNVRFPIDHLESMDVPYVLALEIPDPDRTFPKLKSRGVPVYRWETVFSGVDESTCDVSRRYRRSLVQLPCHQSLNAVEREWIARSVLEIV